MSELVAPSAITLTRPVRDGAMAPIEAHLDRPHLDRGNAGGTDGHGRD